MNNLILIPARSGSTRVIDKNIRRLNGKPLVAHAIENALQAKSARVVVSTNSEEISDIAQQYGAEVPFLRPEELATATATSISAIIHALLWFKENENWDPEMIAFMPPTNPFIQSVTIRNMFSRLKENQNANSVVTITQPKTHPFRIIKLHDNGMIENGIISIDGKTINDIERSQDWPVVWEGSPACRLTRTRYFLKIAEGHEAPFEITGKTYDNNDCLGYEITEREAFDVDSSNDFKMAQVLSKMI
jgi:CMP-N,N'-diacetyllegionaminic acid synthase